jgi:hypothetical protein
MKPPVCYNCGAPWKPNCEYCGTEYQVPPAFIPEIELARQQLSALAMQSLYDTQLARNAQRRSLSIGDIIAGSFGSMFW